MTEILNSIGINLAKRFMSTQFPVWGADGSKWEDRADTPTFPDLSILPQLGASFIGWKGTQGAGRSGFVDRTFLEAWKRLLTYNETFPQKMIARLPFHFWDYYSGNYTGSPELFGADQAKYFWSIIKSDPGEMPAALDCESFAPWGYINWLNQSRSMKIAGGFRKQFADLAGYEAMLYTNPGMLPYFGDQFKGMNLWLSWYNEKRTYADLQALLKKNSWRGKVLIWQYASDGDLDEDGVGDGLKLGMEEKALDLNVWLGTKDEFSDYCKTGSVSSAPPVIEDPVKTAKVIAWLGVKIRSTPRKLSNNDTGKKLANGTIFAYVTEVKDGEGNTWLQVESGWVCSVYRGETLIKKL